MLSVSLNIVSSYRNELIRLLLTSTINGFKNTAFGFLCHKIDLWIANPQYIWSPRFTEFFKKHFCYSKDKRMATSQRKIILFSIFRGDHAVFNCFMI